MFLICSWYWISGIVLSYTIDWITEVCRTTKCSLINRCYLSPQTCVIERRSCKVLCCSTEGY